eukprot:TRINITY_DN16630_c0_g4_i1.p1 TRINITY_DN16630_c0_g4~~TRINITY_DN16630_c0_g4_i1.p1  ORF type:complete len:302 (+),score=42.26 TRINITY_DN16630_c0_g4_i1:102-1007(+)
MATYRGAPARSTDSGWRSAPNGDAPPEYASELRTRSDAEPKRALLGLYGMSAVLSMMIVWGLFPSGQPVTMVTDGMGSLATISTTVIPAKSGSPLTVAAGKPLDAAPDKAAAQASTAAATGEMPAQPPTATAAPAADKTVVQTSAAAATPATDKTVVQTSAAATTPATASQPPSSGSILPDASAFVTAASWAAAGGSAVARSFRGEQQWEHAGLFQAAAAASVTGGTLLGALSLFGLPLPLLMGAVAGVGVAGRHAARHLASAVREDPAAFVQRGAWPGATEPLWQNNEDPEARWDLPGMP